MRHSRSNPASRSITLAVVPFLSIHPCIVCLLRSANQPKEIPTKLYQMWQRSGSAQGPYPFPVMFSASLGSSVVAALVHALDTQPELLALQRYLRRKPPTARCDPEPDSGLGYLITRIAGTLPIVWADFTSSGRTHFWRTGGTERQLKSSILYLHGQKKWDEQVRWAACTVAGSPATADVFNVIGCEPAAPRFRRAACKNQPEESYSGVGGSRAHRTDKWSLNRSACEEFIDQRPGLPAATWCSATGVALRKDSDEFRKGFVHWPPLPATFLDGVICNASEPAECTADNYDEPLLKGRARAAEALTAHAKAGLKASRRAQRPAGSSPAEVAHRTPP